MALFYSLNYFLFRQPSPGALYIESILHLPYGMVLRCKEGIKIPEPCLCQFSSHLLKPHVHPCPFSVFYCLVNEVLFSSVNFRHGAFNVVSSELSFLPLPALYYLRSHSLNHSFIRFNTLGSAFFASQHFLSKRSQDNRIILNFLNLNNALPFA